MSLSGSGFRRRRITVFDKDAVGPDQAVVSTGCPAELFLERGDSSWRSMVATLAACR